MDDFSPIPGDITEDNMKWDSMKIETDKYTNQARRNSFPLSKFPGQ